MNQNRNTIPIPVYPKGTRILTSVCIPKPEYVQKEQALRWRHFRLTLSLLSLSLSLSLSVSLSLTERTSRTI